MQHCQWTLCEAPWIKSHSSHSYERLPKNLNTKANKKKNGGATVKHKLLCKIWIVRANPQRQESEMCLDASPPSSVTHTPHHSAPWRTPSKLHQANTGKQTKHGTLWNFKHKDATSHLKTGKAVNCWTWRDSRNGNSAWRDMCTSLHSASEGEGEIFTFRQDLEERVKKEETLLLPDGVKHPELHIWGNTDHLFGKIHFARKSPQKHFIFTERISQIHTITLCEVLSTRTQDSNGEVKDESQEFPCWIFLRCRGNWDSCQVIYDIIKRPPLLCKLF